MIGIACYKDRVATLWHKSDRIYVVKNFGVDVEIVKEIRFYSSDLWEKVFTLEMNNIQILICGAITCWMIRFLEGLDIGVCPWIKGSVDEVLCALRKGDITGLIMPGCKKIIKFLGGGV